MNRAPVQKVMCATCPFRDAPEAWIEVRNFLEERALTEGTPECHSTGKAAIEFEGKRGIPVKLCRGARNLQLQLFHGLGFIDAPTDEAWDKKRRELCV